MLGVFVRLIKLNASYMEFLARLVRAHPRFHLIIAGPGDPHPVEIFLEQQPEIAARVRFMPGSVDLNLYGPAIDLMCDTFPFIGGNACREVSAHGTPVISKLGTPWDEMLRADRNPELLAASEEEYIALAVRMATDEEFRRKQRRVATAKAAEYSVPDSAIEDIEAAIVASMGSRPNGLICEPGRSSRGRGMRVINDIATVLVPALSAQTGAQIALNRRPPNVPCRGRPI